MSQTNIDPINKDDLPTVFGMMTKPINQLEKIKKYPCILAPFMMVSIILSLSNIISTLANASEAPFNRVLLNLYYAPALIVFGLLVSTLIFSFFLLLFAKFENKIVEFQQLLSLVLFANIFDAIGVLTVAILVSFVQEPNLFIYLINWGFSVVTYLLIVLGLKKIAEFGPFLSFIAPALFYSLFYLIEFMF
ncbi:hypothetical protein BKP35_10520 [Anaerobacillus arseniciselenatis]|uniref:Yip1 domain-containing protein n=1 Tax=Anaerobacillus arseniciselenatis TaxID=85682 RepID=A0A1S2LKM2_9BACI|nr:YIP1 family protein [Anaerobacillus arseniciselenatis]OIJ12613.1 hypothetical protein BKP35_10520 [Anaerobacillus arseniciselenatis]